MRPETAQHIIQVCPRTSSARMRRHDRVVQFVSAAAERAGFKVLFEPRIVGHTLGVRKLDLVLWNESKAYVAVVTITSDRVGRAKAHRDKIAYYDQPEIREWVTLRTGLTDVSFSAVGANWRGVLSPLSAEFLKSETLSNWDISLLGLWICEETYHIHRCFGRGTFRVASRVAPVFGPIGGAHAFYLFYLFMLLNFSYFFFFLLIKSLIKLSKGKQ